MLFLLCYRYDKKDKFKLKNLVVFKITTNLKVFYKTIETIKINIIISHTFFHHTRESH